eukprot:symbB.v1.2.009129.t1/scaffold577.1/size258142/4
MVFTWWFRALEAIAECKALKMQGALVTYTKAINMLDKSNQWQHALSCLEDLCMKAVQVDTIVFNSVISACGKSGHWQIALSLLSRLDTSTLKPDVITHNALISSCEKKTQWTIALQLFESLCNQQLQASLISYSAAVSACQKSGQWAGALALFCQASACQLEADVIFYSAAISACCADGFVNGWCHALELMRKAISTGVVNAVLCSAAISACESGSQWQVAFEIFRQQEELGLRSDEFTLSALMSSCETASHWHHCFELLDSFHFARQLPRGLLLAMTIAMVKLFLFWACGTADIVTDIMFVSSKVAEGFDFDSKVYLDWVVGDYVVGSLSFLFLVLWPMWHFFKGVGVCFTMVEGSTAGELANDKVSTANSPFLLFVWMFRPSVLRQYSDFIETPHPWNSRMLLDLVIQDVPSLVLNIVDTWVLNNSSFINTASIITSIASIVLSWWMIRRNDGEWNSKPNMANARTADGVSAVNSVIGVAEAASQA